MDESNDTVITINKDTASPEKPSRKLRIIHISDTHLQHDQFLQEGLIPDGDILIHSGDFDFYRFKRRLFPEFDFQEQVKNMNDFFDKLPHKHKIFIAGNHETNFPWKSVDEIQSALPSVIYLQDSYVDIEGLRIYGTPWTGTRWFSLARAFNVAYSDLHEKWDLIPDDVDILVTHSPPFGIMDTAGLKPWMSLWMAEDPCDKCDTTHVLARHMGSRSLLEAVLHRIRPKLHLFGHVHEYNDHVTQDDIVFSNGVMKGFVPPKARIIDFNVQS